MYRLFIRPILFLFPPEFAHRLALAFAKWIWKLGFGRWLTRLLYRPITTPSKQLYQIGDVILRNPIGLAAGFDKNADLLHGIENIGVGFVEIGTVTPRPQFGNPSPRMFRIAEQQALVNRLGFPNDGQDVITETIKRASETCSIPIGVNLGKNKDTPNDRAVEDYVKGLRAFQNIAGYFVINLSSPNTPGLRDLQNDTFLNALAEGARGLKLRQPLLLKLAPDISSDHLKTICELCSAGQVFSGLVLTNTLPVEIPGKNPEKLTGGLSGKPLRGASLQTLKMARQLLAPTAPIISVGGISTAADVKERLAAGANAVQIYSALVYKGPGLIRRLNRKIQK